METFLHLSLPVTALDTALAFYVDTVGCTLGRVRREQGFADVWFYGMQLTLQEQPEQVLPADAQAARHFGAALPRDELEAVLARLDRSSVTWLERPTVDTEGRLNGKTGAKFADPSGNVIELKSYPGGRADIFAQ